MAGKNRAVFHVDEDAIRRMVAGDTTALEKMKVQVEADNVTPSEAKEGKSKSATEMTSERFDFDDYRTRFLQHRLTGTRRQTYIHDSLYKAFAKVLPVIAPEMSVPTFINNVLAEHLNKYKATINAMYSQETTQKALE